MNTHTLKIIIKTCILTTSKDIIQIVEQLVEVIVVSNWFVPETSD